MQIPKSSISISFSDIKNAVREEKKKSKNFSKEIEHLFSYQSKKERDFISHFQWKGPPHVQEKDLEMAEELVTNAFKKDLQRNDEKNHKSLFLDSSSLENLAYVAKNIIIFDGPQFRTGYSFIRKIITDVRLIGAVSSNGYAMSANMFNKYKELFVIKAPKENNSFYMKESVNHELVVGKILNSLRPIIPNFAFVLGSFDCGPPIVKPSSSSSKNGKLISWCRGGTPVKYIIYENISDSKSMYDYIKTCSAQEFIDLIIQINYALMVAFKTVGFTHYDLHTSNILIRSLKNLTKGSQKDGYYIPYQGDFVYASVLATFIDYGYSHVYLPGTTESVGIKTQNGPRDNLFFLEKGIYMDRPHPFGDCYHLLIYCFLTLYSYNRLVYEKVKGLINFFYPISENIESHMNDEDFATATYFGSSEYMDNVKKFRYENFIKYCREYCELNNFDDPVVSGRDYVNEIDANFIFSGSVFDVLNVLNDEIKSDPENVKTLENIFDLVEPILVYRKYLDTNTKSFGKEKIGNHKEIAWRIFEKVMANQNHYLQIFNNDVFALSDDINNLKIPRYIEIPEKISLLRDPYFFMSYTEAFEKIIHYIDMVDLLERKYEMAEFIEKEIFRPYNLKTKNIKDLFEAKDGRKQVFSVMRNDIGKIEDFISKNEVNSEDKVGVLYSSLLASLPHNEQWN